MDSLPRIVASPSNLASIQGATKVLCPKLPRLGERYSPSSFAASVAYSLLARDDTLVPKRTVVTSKGGWPVGFLRFACCVAGLGTRPLVKRSPGIHGSQLGVPNASISTLYGLPVEGRSMELSEGEGETEPGQR